MVSELHNRSDAARQQFVRGLTSAIRQGEFRGLSEPAVWLQSHPDIEEQILRDAVLGGALLKRFHKVAGRDWDVQPGEEGDPYGDLASTVAKALLRKIRNFNDARCNLAQACFRAQRHSKIHPRPMVLTIGDGRPRTWLVPVRLEDYDSRAMRRRTEVDSATGDIRGIWQKWNIGKGEWQDLSQADDLCMISHVYQAQMGNLGHGLSLREMLGWTWYARTHTGQETLQAIEKYAQGQKIAKIAGYKAAAASDTNAQLFADYVAEIEDTRGRHTIAIDADDELDVLMPSGTGWELLRWFREELKKEALELILGSNLPTSAGAKGSYAAADVQSEEGNELIEHDREILEETLTRDLVQWCWHANWPNIVELGLANSMPRFSITQKKRVDPKAVVDVAAVATSIGLPISQNELYEKLGFRKPEPGEETVKAPAATQPGGMFPQIPGFGGGEQ